MSNIISQILDRNFNLLNVKRDRDGKLLKPRKPFRDYKIRVKRVDIFVDVHVSDLLLI